MGHWKQVHACCQYVPMHKAPWGSPARGTNRLRQHPPPAHHPLRFLRNETRKLSTLDPINDWASLLAVPYRFHETGEYARPMLEKYRLLVHRNHPECAYYVKTVFAVYTQ